MAKSTGSEWAIHYDAVHIITVNFDRAEARLFENGGSSEGTLIFKSDEPAAKVSITDAMQLIDMALRFGISYDLLARTADADTLKVFEHLGIKTLLDRVVALTTELERHQRFEGFEFSFAKLNGETPKSDEQPDSTEEVVEETAGKKKPK